MIGQSIIAPFPTFFDNNRELLEDGYIYIGQSGLNPKVSPVDIFWDKDYLYPAAQPIRTINGLPSRSGTPSTIYTKSQDYSILVENKTNELIYSALVFSGIINEFLNPVDTIAELRLIDVDFIADQQSIEVNSYYAPLIGLANPYDGGGGKFIWNASSTDTDNGGTIIKATGITTGRWKRLYSGGVNVKWFGAYSDNTNPAITTAAFIAAMAVEYLVELPMGTYSITGIAQTSKPNHIKGLGLFNTGDVVINTTDAIGWEFPVASTASRYTTLEGLRIQPAVGTAGVVVENAGINTEDFMVFGGAPAIRISTSVRGNYRNSSFYADPSGTAMLLDDNGVATSVIWNNIFDNVLLSCTGAHGGGGNGAVGLQGTAGTSGSKISGNTFNNLIIEQVNTSIEWATAAWATSRRNVFVNFYTENIFTQYVDEGDDSNINIWVSQRLIVVGGGANPTVPDVYANASIRIIDGNTISSGVITNQVTFPATQVSSGNVNVLDDYQESSIAIDTGANGQLSSAGGSITLDAASSMNYTKIGRVMTITGHLLVDSVSSPTGNVSLTPTGIPATMTGGNSPMTLYAYGMAATMTTTVVGTIGSGSTAFLIQKTNGSGSVAVLAPDIQAGTVIQFSCVYLTD